MKHVVDADKIIKGEVNFSEIEGRYAFIPMRAGIKGFDWKKAFKALNIMSEHGWRYLDWIGGTIGGYLMEREQMSEQVF
ncbi:MAG: hypothetical protein RTV72_17000 [Candidatus Thorarchaeota archaeon]